MSNVGNGLQVLIELKDKQEQLTNNLTHMIMRYEQYKGVTLKPEYSKGLYHLNNLGVQVYWIREDANGVKYPLIDSINSVRRLMFQMGYYWNNTLGSWMQR